MDLWGNSPIHIGSWCGIWGYQGWFWFRPCTWLSPGYIKDTVLISSCNAWPSQSSQLSTVGCDHDTLISNLKSVLLFHPLQVPKLFRVTLPFIPFLVPQAARLGVRCPYPGRRARPTARLAVNMGRLGVSPSPGPPICLV